VWQTEADKIRALGDRARELGKLKNNSGWSELESLILELRSAYEERLARRLLSGGVNADPVDQRSIDYQRGFFRALDLVLQAPDNAEKALETALKGMEKHV